MNFNVAAFDSELHKGSAKRIVRLNRGASQAKVFGTLAAVYHVDALADQQGTAEGVRECCFCGLANLVLCPVGMPAL